MLDSAFYFVIKDIAIRSGVVQNRYRIADGRFVLDNNDLARVRFTTDEYISGLEGVEKTDKETALRLIKENGYQMGLEEETPQTEENKTETLESSETEAQEEVTDDDSNAVVDETTSETTDTTEETQEETNETTEE